MKFKKIICSTNCICLLPIVWMAGMIIPEEEEQWNALNETYPVTIPLKELIAIINTLKASHYNIPQ